MKTEYREGPEATETFEKGMKLLFQAPKPPLKKKPKKQAATLRKMKRADKD